MSHPATPPLLVRRHAPTYRAMMKPEHAVAIRAFDYTAAVSFGAVAALSSWYLVPDLLATPLSAIAGMGVGVVSAFPLLGLFTVLLGGFEIIVMSMQIGMLAGMMGVMTGGITVGMTGLTTGSDTVVSVALAGALTGLAIQFLLSVTDRALHGEVVQEAIRND